MLRGTDIPIAVDTETTGLDVASGDHFCIGVSIACVIEGEAFSHYFGIAHESGGNISDDTFDLLKEVLGNAALLIYANRQFDVLSLETVNIQTDDREFIDICTMAHLINENKPMNKGVDSLAKYYLGEETGKIKDPYVEKEKKTGNHNITPEEEFLYASMDAELTWRIWNLLKENRTWRELVEETDVWTCKQDLIRTLTAMRRIGIKVDTKLAREQIEKGERRMDEIRAELGYEKLGPLALTEIFLERLKLPVLKRTPTGAPSFDKGVMEQYDIMLERLDSKEASLIKEYRGWQKAIGASFRPYVELLSKDGRLRPTFHTHRVATGRLSCSDPNLQQISKDGGQPWNEKVKKCFIPEKGYVLLSADYSQLELRLAAAYAGEELLKEVFNEGRDIFSEMGSQLGMKRQDAKTLTYSLQYGAGIRRLMNVFGVSKQQAEAIKNNFWSTYPRIKALNDACAARVTTSGRLRIWTGRYRHFEYSSDSYKAMNSLIQGGAADIVERVMTRAHRELNDGVDCRMLIQVHDALVFEVKRAYADEYREKIKALMEDIDGALPEAFQGAFNVHFNVEVEEWS